MKKNLVKEVIVIYQLNLRQEMKLENLLNLNQKRGRQNKKRHLKNHIIQNMI